MRDFRGRVAVVTGAASGIGRALAARFAKEDMKVVLADVERTALDATVAALRDTGAEVTGVPTDVSRYDDVARLARQTLDTYGAVHIVCNNAGIGTDETRSTIWQSPDNDWTWAFRVNVWGVLHGIKAFVPIMLERGEDGHVVNTSSGNGGLYPLPTTPIYATTKAAVTTISEVLHHQLQMAGAKVRASVLYPGPNIVATNIFSAARNRPDDLPYETPPTAPPPTLADIRGMYEAAGLAFAVTEPEEVADYAVEGIRNDRFWILPPSEQTDAAVRARLEGILARRNPSLSSAF
jgi:NAD(P)-dependent dehydrogenase (short-subunit alcohol dehydrogenase family)